MQPRTVALRPPLRLISGGDAGRPSPEDDQRLAAAFVQGLPGAGAALYDRLLPVVDATLVRVLGRREQDHRDLVQSTFEQIVRTVAGGKYAGTCTLAGWASVLACHVGLNALRSRRRERNVVDRDRGLDTPLHAERAVGRPIEEQLGARDELAVVRLHLSLMDPGRVVVLLLNAMGYDLREIAGLTRSSVVAAQSRLSRGRRELRKRVGASRPDLPPDASRGSHDRT